MQELNRDYFDRQYGDLIEFLGKEFSKVATKDEVSAGFAEQAVSLSFIESQLSTLRKDLAQLSKRTKEDDGAFIKDLLKLKSRMDQFEKQLKKLKAVHA